jgi:hypothetical protein
MDHVKWLISVSDLMKQFFTMDKNRHGNLHFKDCVWMTESTIGPDTCKCVTFLMDLQCFLNNSKN